MPVLLKEFWRAGIEIATALIAWIIVFPISIVIPRDPCRIVVIGRDTGAFSDNAKYFFIHAHHHARDTKARVEYLTENRSLSRALKQHGAKSTLYPSIAGLWSLLRAGIIVMDSAEWIRKGRFQASIGAFRLQLWHGIPLKQIEIPLYRKRLSRTPSPIRWIISLQKAVIGRYTKFDILLSTSSFVTQHAFQDAFRAKRIVEYGYPRNDILSSRNKNLRKDPLTWINTDKNAIRYIQDARRRGLRIVLYAPTFRRHFKSPLEQGALDIERLSRFAKRHRILIVFKLHPLMSAQLKGANFDYVVEYDAEADVYPALSLTDALVTDYSSIYFDYLLLDRPIIFFPFDYETYISQDRTLVFNYDAMAPGHKCKTQQELETSIKELLQAGDDGYADERNRVREAVFSHHDDAAATRIWSYLMENHLKSKAGAVR